MTSIRGSTTALVRTLTFAAITLLSIGPLSAAAAGESATLRFGDIVVRADVEQLPAVMVLQLQALKGEPFEAAALKARLDALRQAHVAAGYAFSTFAPKQSVDKVQGSVKLVVSVEQGPLTRFDLIRIVDEDQVVLP